MVLINTAKQCFVGRIKVLNLFNRCSQLSSPKCFRHQIQLYPLQSCRLYHFNSLSGTCERRLLQTGGQRVSNHKSQWSLRNFQSRRRLKEEHEVHKTEKLPGGNLFKPFLFTIGCCGVSFTGAMIWQYEVMRYHAKRLLTERRRSLDSLLEKTFGFRAHVNSMWNNLNAGQKMVAGFILANLGVFLLWRIPAMMPFMTRYFTCQPGGTLSSMVLCSLSHYSFIHLFCNMYVLWSFSSVALSLFGREQLSAVFLTAASFSSLTSLIAKRLRGRVVPSLGASGALMAVLGAVCVSYPNARLSIAFIGELLPHSFSASTAMTGIILFDAAGLLLGWKMFDHAAHLGGMLFGIWYVTYGRDLIWKNREVVMKMWHDVRGNP